MLRPCFVVTVYPIRGWYGIHIIPCSHIIIDDQTRVRMMPYEGVDGSDYINANYIDVSCDQFHLWRLNDTIPKTLLLAVLTV